MQPLIIRPEAEADLATAFDWDDSQIAGLGAEFLLSVEATLGSIQRNSHQYAVIHHQTHRALTRRFPFAVFYIAEPQAVIVLAILHARRNPHTWQHRQ
jgi:plasmid stabilization system protein ParE